MTKVKATKKLTDIDFSGKNAAVALVGKDQGGGANGFTTLLVKSAKYTDEHLEKASKVRVTMELTEFMQRYFNMYYEDSFILAQALGFDTTPDDTAEVETYQDYIDSKVAAFEIIKQLENSEDVDKTLSDLDPDDYLVFLKSQETLEKAFKKIDKSQSQNSKPTVKAVEQEEGTLLTLSQDEAKATTAEGVPSSKTKPTEKSKMTVKTVEQEIVVEMVEKSQFENISKALQEQGVALEKALEAVKQFEIEKAAGIQKSRKDLLTATVKDEAKVEALVKGLANVETEEIFQEVVKALAGMMIVQTNSDLFKEKGFSSEEASKEEVSPLMKAAIAAAEKAKSAK